MTMLKEDFLQLNRGGDILAWYYYNFFEMEFWRSEDIPNVPKEIAEELLNFEREMLQDISGKTANIGITDFISAMALPSFIWKDQFEFLRLYSLDDTARNQIFSLFNYLPYPLTNNRIDLRLKEPNFENFSLPMLCSERRNSFSGYCDLVETLPDLKVIMHLMHLAQYPLNFNENIKTLFK